MPHFHNEDSVMSGRRARAWVILAAAALAAASLGPGAGAADGPRLPKLKDFPAEFGGSGAVVPE